MSVSCYECLICCDPSIDTSFSVENASTLCRTIIGQCQEPSRFISDDEYYMDDSIPIPISFSLLIQSATYCPKCVARIQDLEILFRELEALERKLETEKSRIKSQLRLSYDQKRSTVDNRNQKLRKKIVTRMNYARATDAVNMERQQLQSSIPVFSEVNTPNAGSILSPPSPTPSVTSLASFDEEKFYPQELSNIDLDLASTSNSTVTNSQRNPRLSAIILHKLSNVETKGIIERSRLRKRRAEIKPRRSKVQKIPQKRGKVTVAGTRASGYHSNSIEVQSTELEKSESNISNQPKPKPKPKPNGKKSKNNSSDNIQRTRCSFPDCIVTFRGDYEIRLKAHVRKIHEGIKKCYLCETENCGLSFYSLKELLAHDSWKHKGISPYVCSHCEEVCTSEHHLKLHIAVNHKPEDIRLKCEFCDRAFINRTRLKLHLMKHTKKRPFMCEICSKTFNTSQVLKYHQSKHHTEMVPFDPYKCNECGKIFAAPDNLKGHIKRIHERGEFKYQCEICGYGTLTPSGLKQHMDRRHSDVKDFKCDECGVCYKVKHQLTVHIRTHTGERPYVCKTEGCGKSFTDSGGFRRHELIHSREQCHECQICGKTFPLHNYLYVHMKSHKKKNLAEPKLNAT